MNCNSLERTGHSPRAERSSGQPCIRRCCAPGLRASQWTTICYMRYDLVYYTVCHMVYYMLCHVIHYFNILASYRNLTPLYTITQTFGALGAMLGYVLDICWTYLGHVWVCFEDVWNLVGTRLRICFWTWVEHVLKMIWVMFGICLVARFAHV